MKVSLFYKDIILLNSKDIIYKYMQKFANKKLVIYFEKETYQHYEDVLKLSDFDISFMIDIDSKNIDTYGITSNNNILILVEDFYYHTKVYKYLYDNNLYKNDICNDLLLHLDILSVDRYKLLWDNIIKLESNLNYDDTKYIINKNHFCYVDLFENMLLKNNFIKNNYAYSLIYVSQYRDIFGDLLKLNDLIVFTDSRYKYNNFFYGLKYLRFFNFINLFIGTSFNKLPPKSKYINIKHGILDHPNPILNDNEVLEQSFYIEKNRIKTSVNIVGSKIFKNKNTILLGYPKLDYFIDCCKKVKSTDSISIILSSVLWNKTKLSSVLQDKNSIQNIIEKFYDYKIILRAHPGEMDLPQIKKYIDNFKGYNNFIFDKNLSYIDNFSKTKVLISDGLASSTYTYVFATLKPIILYIPNIEEYINNFKNIYHIKYLDIIGDIVTNDDELQKMIYKYLNDKNHIQEKSLHIKELKDKIIVNIGCSNNQIISFIEKYKNIDNCNQIVSYYKNKFIKKARNKITNYFDEFKDKKIAIYGVGTHFETVLMNIYDFNRLNIICFSDSNSKVIGKKKFNKIIVDKNNLTNLDAIIISSKAYEQEIEQELLKKYKNVIPIYKHLDKEISLCLEDKLWIDINIIETKLTQEKIDKIISLNIDNYDLLINQISQIQI